MIRGSVRAVAALCIATTLVALCACQTTETKEPAVDSASSDAPKLTRSEYIASARVAYGEYLKVVQKISEDGNRGFERLRPFVSDAAYADEVSSFKKQAARGIHTSGSSQIKEFKAQQVDLGLGSATAYVCIDLSKVHVINAKNKDVTPSRRPNLQTFAPTFITRGNAVILEENRTWSGESVC